MPGDRPKRVTPLPLTSEPWLSKKQTAAHFGRTTRWVELRMREGMPHRKEPPGVADVPAV